MTRPWMPLYVGDYLGDTSHLTTTEHGAYMLLIMHYWAKGGLPDDDVQLARIVRMSLDGWTEIRATIQSFFFDGWKHRRVEFELTETDRLSAAGRTGGLASGKVRRERSLQNRSNDSPTIREALTTTTTTTTTEERKKEDAPRRAPSRKALLPDDWKPERPLTSQGEAELAKMRDWARSNAVLKADWAATWRNWMRRVGGICEMPEANLNADIGFYAEFGSVEQDAWDAHYRATRRMNAPRDKRGGWTFPTQWPPDHKAEQAA